MRPGFARPHAFPSLECAQRSWRGLPSCPSDPHEGERDGQAGRRRSGSPRARRRPRRSTPRSSAKPSSTQPSPAPRSSQPIPRRSARTTAPGTRSRTPSASASRQRPPAPAKRATRTPSRPRTRSPRRASPVTTSAAMTRKASTRTTSPSTRTARTPPRAPGRPALAARSTEGAQRRLRSYQPVAVAKSAADGYTGARDGPPQLALAVGGSRPLTFRVAPTHLAIHSARPFASPVRVSARPLLCPNESGPSTFCISILCTP